MDRIPDNFRPLRGHVLIRRDDPDAEKGGIIIPELWRLRGCRARVVEVGEGVEGVKPGDAILFQKEYTVLPFKEREMAITESGYILARLELDGNVERIMPLDKWVLMKEQYQSGEIGGIVISDKTSNDTAWGTVIRIGCKCLDIKPQMFVYFETQKNLVCVENDAYCRLIKEEDILCCKILEDSA